LNSTNQPNHCAFTLKTLFDLPGHFLAPERFTLKESAGEWPFPIR
jgi:hypothetical protein